MELESGIDLLDLFNEDIDPRDVVRNPSGVSMAPSEIVTERGGGPGLPTVSSEDIQGMSYGEYLQKFKEVFIKARPLNEIMVYASSMGFKDWMDFVVKLMPKDVKVQGEVNFIHQLESLGPIDKSQYQIVDAEVVDGNS